MTLVVLARDIFDALPLTVLGLYRGKSLTAEAVWGIGPQRLAESRLLFCSFSCHPDRSSAAAESKDP